MSLYDLKTEALALPETWHSRVLGRIGTANLKVLRMDERSVIEERFMSMTRGYLSLMDVWS
jgi:hypothetical protein